MFLVENKKLLLHYYWGGGLEIHWRPKLFLSKMPGDTRSNGRANRRVDRILFDA